ncbi:MAG TPA: hypothetical protein VKR58_06130 [Aquella sp.]|nr:hypothetical protein [Aquella sp.]
MKIKLEHVQELILELSLLTENNKESPRINEIKNPTVKTTSLLCTMLEDNEK